MNKKLNYLEEALYHLSSSIACLSNSMEFEYNKDDNALLVLSEQITLLEQLEETLENFFNKVNSS